MGDDFIFRSDGVDNSEFVLDSSGVDSSRVVDGGRGVYNSTGVIEGYGVYDSMGVCDCHGVGDCCFVRLCSMAESCIFCYSFTGQFALFNKPISLERFVEVFDKIENYNWLPEDERLKELFNSETDRILLKDMYSDFPEDLERYIRSLPEFDESIWRNVTGLGSRFASNHFSIDADYISCAAQNLKISYSCTETIKELLTDICDFGADKAAYGIFVKREAKIPFSDKTVTIDLLVDYLLCDCPPDPDELGGGRAELTTLGKLLEIFKKESE